MISTNISISTVEITNLQKHIKTTILKELQDKIRISIPLVNIALREEILQRIKSSDVLRELQSGTLRLDLGLTQDEAENMANIIPEIISKSTNVRSKKTFDSIDIVVDMISRGYEDLLTLPQATYIQNHTKGEPKEIPWLSWLLTKGDTIVVGEFRVKYTPGNPNSRSGGAIMLKGQGFRVPPQFSGVEDDNFITKALINIEEFIYREIVKHL